LGDLKFFDIFLRALYDARDGVLIVDEICNRIYENAVEDMRPKDGSCFIWSIKRKRVIYKKEN
jgi:hypothetical protein